MGAEDRIESARDLFLDSRSLEIFDAEMLYRTTGRWSSRILDLMDANVYLPSFFKGIKEINFVDGGAFDGDTIEDFVKHDISFREIYCFEPDSKNRNALEKRIKRLNLGCPMTLFPLGLNDTFEMLKFEESGKASSAFSENGNICIQTVPLDRILKNKPISYIKMDIEGSELNALKGCEDIISKNHPLMAICVYHRPEHLWEVPLFLKSLNKNYHFFLRLYTQNCFETVCYALDDETLSQFQ